MIASAKDQSHHKRIYWQCRRGMLELDILLQTFFADYYDYLTGSEKEAFQLLLSYSDRVLHKYLIGGARPADRTLAHVIDRIRHPAAP